MPVAGRLPRPSIIAFTVALLVGAVLPAAAAADDPAVAVEDAANPTEDAGAVHIDVLANDSDADGGAFVVTAVAGGVKGTPSVGAVGADVIYEPNPDAFGLDQFTYTITGGSTATVYVNIQPVNDPPDAVDDSYEVASGWGPALLWLVRNDLYAPDDYEYLTIVSTTAPQHGTIEVWNDKAGVYYEPDAGYLGPDSFTYTLSDGHGGTDTATVDIEVVIDTTGPTSFAPWERLIYRPPGTWTVATKLYWRYPSDLGSGVASQQLQVSVNSGAFANVALPNPPDGMEGRDRWAMNLTINRTYQFRNRAKDRAGNVGTWATAEPFTVKRSQENTSLAAYRGHWSRSYQSNAPGGATYRTGQAGASVTFTFNGTDLALVGTRTTSSGGARMYLDGQYQGVLSFKSFKTDWRRIIVTRHLATGRHTLTIKAVGNGRIDIDAFAVLR